MKTRARAITLAVLFLTGWSLATAETTKQTSEQIRVELDLVDGSRVIGVPAITSIPLQTSYASMDIPLAANDDLGNGRGPRDGGDHSWQRGQTQRYCET
ncbi:MAG: hypothetical protein ACOX3F_07295 [Kiritimatiellia bacterium]